MIPVIIAASRQILTLDMKRLVRNMNMNEKNETERHLTTKQRQEPRE